MFNQMLTVLKAGAVAAGAYAPTAVVQALGFTAAGVQGGTIAASVQSMGILSTFAAPAFSVLQSVGVLGLPYAVPVAGAALAAKAVRWL